MNDHADQVEAIIAEATDILGFHPMDLLLHTEQRNLTWGSTYAIFAGLDLPQPEHQYVMYGTIPTQQLVIEQMRKRGIEPEARAGALEFLQAKLDTNILIGAIYSHHAPLHGVTARYHKAIAWPIPHDVFGAAARAGFDWDRFDSGTKAHLGIACAAWRTHRATTGGRL